MPELTMTCLVMMGGMMSVIRPLSSGFFVVHALIMCVISYVVAVWWQDMPFLSSHAMIVILSGHVISINAFTFLAYAFDKQAAIQGKWRVPEKQLHALALVGGAPAAFFAQKKLRHKINKTSFQRTFKIIIVVEIVIIVYGFYLFSMT